MRSLLFILTLASTLLYCNKISAGTEGRLPWNRSGIKQYAKQAWKNSELLQISEGTVHPKGIEQVSVTFGSDQAVELSEARKMIVEEVIRLSAYLKAGQTKSIITTNGAFNQNHLQYMLTFHPPSGGYYNPPYITSALYMGDRIVYDTRRLSGHGFDRVHEETFKEAVKIVADEAKINPSFNFKPITTDANNKRTLAKRRNFSSSDEAMFDEVRKAQEYLSQQKE